MTSMFDTSLIRQMIIQQETFAANTPKVEVPTSDKQVNRRSTQINNSGVRYNNATIDVNADKWKGLI